MVRLMWRKRWPGAAPCSLAGAVNPSKTSDPRAHTLYLFFRVDDIDAALARVRELCGVIVHHDSSDDPVSIARFGQFALCKDDQGSSFGLHQPPR